MRRRTLSAPPRACWRSWPIWRHRSPPLSAARLTRPAAFPPQPRPSDVAPSGSAPQVRQAGAPLHQLPHRRGLPCRRRGRRAGGPAGHPQRGSAVALFACAVLPACLLVLRLPSAHHPAGLQGGGALSGGPGQGVGAAERSHAPTASRGTAALGGRHTQLPHHGGSHNPAGACSNTTFPWMRIWRPRSS